MEREYCVYMHTAPNGKRYVGITCCHPRNRRWQNGYGYVENNHFFSAIKKYGWNQFTHEILADNLTADEAGQLETAYIEYYNTTDKNLGYNLMPGGNVGFHLCEEHKKKISEANSGKGNGMYGYRYSDEERRLMSERSVWRGKKHTEESRQKMRDSMAKRYESGWKPLSGREHPNVRAVEQYTLDGKHIETYYSAADAEEKTGATRSGICECAKGRAKSAGGFIWQYADDEDKSNSVRDKVERMNVQGNSKPVMQFTETGEYVRSFLSARLAAAAVGISSPNMVTDVCRGRRKTTGGYIWRYAE